ncbi:hypothetical protein ACEOWG_000560 [Bacillus cereus]
MRTVDLLLEIEKEQFLIRTMDGTALEYKTSVDFDRNIDLSLINPKFSIPNNGSSIIVLYQGDVVVAKQCTKCKVIHLLNTYHNAKSNLAGKVPKCKICISEESKRTMNIPLDFDATRRGYTFTNPMLGTYNPESNFDVSTYQEVKAYLIKDGRSKSDFIVLYEVRQS